jgi:hypothetical protein
MRPLDNPRSIMIAAVRPRQGARNGAERRRQMQRISSRMTFFYKRVFPIMFFGVLVVAMIVPFAKGTASREFLIVPLMMVAFGFFMMKMLIFDLVDEVWDTGDALIVRNRSQEDRIPLSSIINVGYSPWINPPRVTLSLRTPSSFGDKVVFCAPVRFMPFTESPIVDDLIRRIDAARMRAR